MIQVACLQLKISPEMMLLRDRAQLQEGIDGTGVGGPDYSKQEEGDQAPGLVRLEAFLKSLGIHSPLIGCSCRQQPAVADPSYHAGLLQRAVRLQMKQSLQKCDRKAKNRLRLHGPSHPPQKKDVFLFSNHCNTVQLVL